MLPVVLLHDVDGPNGPGFRRLASLIRKSGHEVIEPLASGGWWPFDSLNQWVEQASGLQTPHRAIAIGVGSGGQSVLRAAYGCGSNWPAAAVIAPACDLGRWFGRGSELDSVYTNADQARQDEGPLHFNPLWRPIHQLCWCDPRDEACLPSALRVVSKSQSSGVPITADLDTAEGTSRDEYVGARASELVDWLIDVRDRIPSGPNLPVVSK